MSGLREPEAGELYLHDRTPTVRVTLPDGTEVVAVPAAVFQQVQYERDAYRRALALVNGLRVLHGAEVDEWLRTKLDRALRGAGMTWADGRAVASIMLGVAERRQQEVGAGA